MRMWSSSRISGSVYLRIEVILVVFEPWEMLFGARFLGPLYVQSLLTCVMSPSAIGEAEILFFFFLLVTWIIFHF